MEPAQVFNGEKYNLRWNSYKNSLVHHLSDHLAQEEHVDVTLACEGKYIKAHKLILSSCSPYFRELFRIHKVDNPLIFLNGVKYNQLKCVIDFVYNGEIKVIDSELEGVLMLGTNLQIKGLCNARSYNTEDKNGCVKTEKLSSEEPDPSTNTCSNISDNKLRPQRKRKQKLVFEAHDNQKQSKNAISSPKQKQTIPKNEENIDMSEILEKPVSELDQNTIRNIIGVSPEESCDAKRRKVVELKKNLSEKLNHKPPPNVDPSTPVPEGNQEASSKPEISTSTASIAETSSMFPPKKVSAFMIFANEWRKRLVVEHPNDSTKQISLRLSNMWKNLSEETKDSFYEEASKANSKANEVQKVK